MAQLRAATGIGRRADSLRGAAADEIPIPCSGPVIERALLGEVESRGWDAEYVAYLHFHRDRYAFLLGLCRGLLERNLEPRILVVGPHFDAELLRRVYPHGVVDTLGFSDKAFPLRPGDCHYAVDLNQVLRGPTVPAPTPVYDLVVCAEVIEHLHTAPELVLRYLAGWADQGSGRVVLQTPNAACLGNRLQMLRGRNPFEFIRISDENPGHFREYTIDELRRLNASVGLEVIDWYGRNYFARADMRRVDRWFYQVCDRLPATLRSGFTLVMARAATP